ncbi:MAG: PKD domain-containing protein [Bacteroidia bacterium]|nr:PKD domain-containing protein [Bacteroidia bacterium]
MNKPLVLKVAITLLFCFSFLFSEATHLMGVDITYECINNCTLRVHTKTFRDCDGNADMNFWNFNWSAPGGCNLPTPVGNWVPGSGATQNQFFVTEVTPVCPGTITNCTQTGAIRGVQEYYRYRDYNICGLNCSTYSLLWDGQARNNGITTLFNSGGPNGAQGMGTSATYNTTLGSCNSSPQFSRPPTPYICAGDTFVFNQGAFDPDGDSLAYRLGPCYDENQSQVIYLAGYTWQDPLGAQWDITVNPITGDVTFLPTPGGIEIGVLCIVVEEWRNGQKIGEVSRDVQVNVINCPNNSAPKVSGATNVSNGFGGTGNSASGIKVYSCLGNNLCFDLPSVDPNSNDSITMWWNNGIPGATFFNPQNVNQVDTLKGAPGNFPKARFCWSNVGPVGTHSFLVEIRDDACPSFGFTQFTVQVIVGQTLGTSLVNTPHCDTASMCANGTVGFAPFTYHWTGAGGLNSNNQCPTHIYPGPGSYPYSVTITDSFGCSHVDTGTVVIAQGVTAAAGPDRAFCTGNMINIGAPPDPDVVYSWTSTNGIGNPNASATTLTLTNGGPAPLVVQYNVLAYDTITKCSNEDSAIFTVSSIPQLSTSSVDNVCFGAGDGSIDLTVAGGLPPLTYAWTGPGGYTASTEDISSLIAGNYTVTVSDTTGCGNTAMVNIDQPPLPLIIQLVPTDVFCSGGSDGSIDNTTSGGSPPYTYFWSNGQITEDIANLPSGFYQVLVTDSLGCQDSATVVVGEPPQIFASINVADASCFGESDGSVNLSFIGGGTPGYTFSWFPSGSTANSIVNVPAGQYQLVVTDSRGCVDTLSAWVQEPPDIVLNVTVTPNSCAVPFDIGVANVTASGGTPGYSYTWNTNPVQTGHIASNLATGSYVCTVIDDKGCADSITAVIPYIPPPVVDAGPNASFCDGEGGAQIFATGTTGTQPYYYNWTCNQPICGLDSINDNDPIANPTVTSWYYVQITDVNGCTSNVDSLIVTVLPKPLVDAGPDMAICADSAPCTILAANITGAPGPFDVQWFPSAGLSSDTVINPCARPDSTTIYYLLATSINGCHSNFTTVDTTSSVIVTVNPLPMGDAGPDSQSICLGDSVELPGIAWGAGPNYFYQWAPATGLSNSSVINPDASPAFDTWYTFTVWSNACPSYSDSVLVKVHTLPTVDAGADQDICLGEEASLHALAGGDSTSSGFTFSWNPNLYVLGSPNVQDLQVKPDTTTLYYVQSTTSWGCGSARDSVLITVKPTPFAEAGPNQNLCYGRSLQMQGSIYYLTTEPAPNPNQVWVTWTPADSLSDTTIVDPWANPTVTTQYFMQVQYNTCFHTDSVLITVFPEIGAGVDADTTVICGRDSVQLYGWGGIGAASYTWIPDKGMADPHEPNPLISPDSSTHYIFVVEEGGCSDTAEISIDVIPTPVPAYISSLQDGCVPFDVSFLDLSVAPIAWTWNFGDGSPVSNEPNPLHTFTTPGTYQVTLTVSNLGECKASISDHTIQVHDTAQVDFDSDPDHPAILALPNSTVSFTDLSTQAADWLWDFGDGLISDEQNPRHQYVAPGTYYVTLHVTTEFGCNSEVTHGPFLVNAPDLLIPNVFTPNGDGFQDRWMINYTGSQPVQISIMDRWGVEQYNSRNKNEGWDGNSTSPILSGAPASEGVYYYVVKIGDKEYVGNLTLLR